jgi:hypothetical protein
MRRPNELRQRASYGLICPTLRRTVRGAPPCWVELLRFAKGRSPRNGFFGLMAQAYLGSDTMILAAILYDFVTRGGIHSIYFLAIPWILVIQAYTSAIYHYHGWTPLAVRLIGQLGNSSMSVSGTIMKATMSFVRLQNAVGGCPGWLSPQV